MASLRQGIYSIYIYHNWMPCFERKILCIVLINLWRQFAGNFFDTNNKY